MHTYKYASLLVCAFGDIFALMFKLGKTELFGFWCLSYPNSFTPILLDFMLEENLFKNNGDNFRLCDIREKLGNTTSILMVQKPRRKNLNIYY